MRRLVTSLCCLSATLAATLALAGCQSFYAATGVATGVDVISLTTVGRTLPDVVVSLIANRDCSMVRLERGQGYCVPPDASEPPAFCTHSLGSADCWLHPALLPGTPLGLADAPAQTPAQLAHGQHHWPALGLEL